MRPWFELTPSLPDSEAHCPFHKTSLLPNTHYEGRTGTEWEVSFMLSRDGIEEHFCVCEINRFSEQNKYEGI